MLSRYINPASDGGDGTTNALTGANAAYASVNAAEAALPATLTDAYEFICETDGTADTSSVTFSGVTTTSTNKVTIKAVAPYRHSGTWNTGKFRISVANSQPMSIQINYGWVDGLQCEKTSSNSGGNACIGIGTVTGGNEVWVSECICRQAGNNSFGEPGIQIGNAARVVFIWNCIAYGTSTAAVTSNAGISIVAGTVTAYSCTLINGYRGVNVTASGTGTFKNCYAHGGSAGYVNAGTMTLTTCASSDTTGSAGLQSIAHSTSNFVNVTAGSQDYHLVSGSALINVGTNTSGDAAPMNFTTDIDGQTRSGTWDVGADEYLVIPIPVFMHHFRQQGISG